MAVRPLVEVLTEAVDGVGEPAHPAEQETAVADVVRIGRLDDGQQFDDPEGRGPVSTVEMDGAEVAEDAREDLALAHPPEHARVEDDPFARLCHETLESEMTLHRSYAADFGISAAELESETKSPVTQAYTDFLLRTAALGDYSELVAALLPCMWGFSEVGTRLREGGVPKEPLSARWVEMYGSQDFGQLAAWCRDILDALADGLPKHFLDRIEAAFITSSRHELAFWDQALTPPAGE